MKLLRSPLPPLFLVIFIDTFGYFLVLPIILRLFLHTDSSSILPPLTSTSVRQWLYSITLMLSPLAFIFLSPFSGHLSDAFGRKKVIGACLAASLIGFILPIIGIVYRHVSLIMLGRFIAGAGTTSQPVAQAAITDFSDGKSRAFNLSLIGLSMTLAMVLGPLAGGYLSDAHLVSWFNPTTPYWTSCFLALINITLLWRYFTDSKTAVQIKARPKNSLFQLFTPTVLCFLLAFTCLQLAWSAFYQGFFIFLSEKQHFSTDKISLFASYAGIWMCLGLTIVYKHWLKHTSISKISKVSLGVTLLSFALLCFNHHTTYLWILVTPIALFSGTAYPSLLHLISKQTPTEHQGWMLGISSTLLGFAWMITGLFDATIISHSMQSLLTLCAGVLVLGFGFSFCKLKYND